MKNLLQKFSPLKRFCRQNKGNAAIEFALVFPVLMTLALGSAELMVRFQITDNFNRYAFQAGDVLSRLEDIRQADIDSIVNTAALTLDGRYTRTDFDIQVASIGFEAGSGDPVMLWTKTTDATLQSINPTDATGFGEQLETVLGVRMTMNATTPFSFVIDDDKITVVKEVFFRPRLSRLIMFEGTEAEQNLDWEET